MFWKFLSQKFGGISFIANLQKKCGDLSSREISEQSQGDLVRNDSKFTETSAGWLNGFYAPRIVPVPSFFSLEKCLPLPYFWLKSLLTFLLFAKKNFSPLSFISSRKSFFSTIFYCYPSFIKGTISHCETQNSSSRLMAVTEFFM